MKLSEIRHEKFLEKKRRLVDREIKKLGGAIKIFEAYKNRPTDQELCNFVVEVNYGSCHDFVGKLLGESVFEEFLTDALMFCYQSTISKFSEREESGILNPQDAYDYYLSEKFISRSFPYTDVIQYRGPNSDSDIVADHF
jgi:hypothetical protein